MNEARLEIAIVVAMDSKGGIGKEGKLPWPRLPKDMARFKDLTTPHPVLMGRKTYDSLPPNFQPLPQRPNIVITRELGRNFPRAHTSHSLGEALQLAQMLDSTRICIIGGSEIYGQALSLADVLYLTRIEGDFDADTFFPEFEYQFPNVLRSESLTHNGINYTFEDRFRQPN
jgi:dihydrofolate reductase